jgi:hypothetical protein
MGMAELYRQWQRRQGAIARAEEKKQESSGFLKKVLDNIR